MSNLAATGGSKVYIGGPMSFTGTDFTASDFNSVVWTKIGGTTNIGAFGDTAQLITSQQVEAGRDRKLKGTRNAGSVQLVCDLDYNDAGQIALLAAEKERHSYAIKYEFNDAPVGGTPSVRYFVALVMSSSEELNDANNVMKLNTTLEIDSNVVRVSAGQAGDAPDNTVLPVITGTAEEGQTLTASTGTWTGTATISYAFQWFADGESLPGANSSTLALTASHVGKVISVMVTASNGVGTASAISAATSAITS